MLAFGWTVERTKEGEAFGMHTCTARLSQSGQVCVLHWTYSLSSVHQMCLFSCKISNLQLNFFLSLECVPFCCVS